MIIVIFKLIVTLMCLIVFPLRLLLLGFISIDSNDFKSNVCIAVWDFFWLWNISDQDFMKEINHRNYHKEIYKKEKNV